MCVSLRVAGIIAGHNCDSRTQESPQDLGQRVSFQLQSYFSVTINRIAPSYRKVINSATGKALVNENIQSF